jgi:hypothetical protein
MTELTTGDRDAILVAKARAGTITSAELRKVSHFSINRIDSWDIKHLSSADRIYLSDEKCEARGRFDDDDRFDDSEDES